MCTYCCNETEVTRDHVVPRALFVGAYPSDPVIVPSCRPCNVGKSRDEPYFSDYLTLDLGGSQSPTAMELFQTKVRRSHLKDKSELIRSVIDTAEVKPLYSSGGVYLGHYPQAPINAQRIVSVLQLMVRGLYYDCCKELLPQSCHIEVFRHNPWDQQGVIDRFFAQGTPATRKIGDVFACGFYRAKDNPTATFWLLIFYGRVLFSATTV